MRLSRRLLSSAFAVILIASGFWADAQTSKGTLTGVARDQSGAVIPGASIKIVDQATSQARSLSSQKDGSYRFDAIDPGPYTIEVSSPGFERSVVHDVQVQPSLVTTHDVAVRVGKVSDTVTVEADNATVNAENGQLAGTINSAELDKLPVFSLNPIELALTVPGVQPVAQGGFSNGFNIQVNGARSRDNNYLVDGQEVNDVSIAGQAFQIGIPDAIASVTVITNSATAEYGRAGGGIVNQITAQGTNTFHGEGYERYFGSGLNSVPGDLRGTGFQNPRQDEHTAGFTLGGPIVKDKLFAFGGLEVDRIYGAQQAGINLLPDTSGYAALQTLTGTPATQVKLLDQYLSGGSYLTVDNQYGTAAGSAAVKTITLTPAQGCPVAACPITFAGFQRPNATLTEPTTQFVFRVDYDPRASDNFSYRYYHSRSSYTPDFGNNGNALAGFDTQQGGPSELAQGTWTHIFTPHLLNELRGSEARISFEFAPTAATAANPLDTLPTFAFASLSGTSTAGAISFPALGPNQNFPQGRREDLYQIQDTLTWTRGRHTVRAGVDLGRLIEIDLVSQNAIGTLSFAAGGTGVTSLGNFLLNQLGPSGSATRTFGKTRVDSHGYRNGAFAQDDIKLSSDLTVNLGIRYDYLTNPINSLPFPGIDPNNPYAPINAYYKVAADYNNISPRLGFAYSPHNGGFLGDGKTSIRGGFGIFYSSTFSNILVNSTQSSPNAVSGTQIQTTGNGLPNATSQIANISPVLNPLSSVLSEANNLVNPISYQYNLGVERELPGQVVLGVRYVGARDEKLFANQQFNFFSGVTGQRLNPARGAVSARGNYADSNYNGVEISGSHNFRHGFDVRANYVYSKDLDDGSEVFAVGSPTSYDANLAPGGRRQDYGPSAYDHRQFFSIAYVWSPTGLKATNNFANAALGVLTRHWTVSGVTQLQSGSSDTVAISGLDNNGDGSNANDRPILGNSSLPLTSVGIDGSYVGGTPGSYYDLSAENNNLNTPAQSASAFHFIVPVNTTNQYLNREIGRNSFQGPGTTRNDIALQKGIGLSYLHFERGTLILRAEGQNVFNHNDNGVGDTNVLDAGAGFLDTARSGSQRVLILWGKIQF